MGEVDILMSCFFQFDILLLHLISYHRKTSVTDKLVYLITRTEDIIIVIIVIDKIKKTYLTMLDVHMCRCA